MNALNLRAISLVKLWICWICPQISHNLAHERILEGLILAHLFGLFQVNILQDLHRDWSSIIFALDGDYRDSKGFFYQIGKGFVSKISLSHYIIDKYSCLRAVCV